MSALREILKAIGQLEDDELDVADAALQLARVDAPGADWLAARAHLSELARDAAGLGASVAADDGVGQVRALARLIGEQYEYQGDAESYDDLANANLIRVIERRRGLPVALGVLWLHAAQAAGWVAYGVNFPGHFLIGFNAGKTVIVDVFAGGRVMETRELRMLLRRVQGPKAELGPTVLEPMTSRDVLLRLQNNIMSRRLRAGAVEEALLCAEDMLAFAPDEASLWRECAALNQRLDRVAAAVICLERFLKLVPRGAVADDARAAMDELRTRLN